MASLPLHEADMKPKQAITATNLPAHTQDPSVVAESLSKLVDQSAKHTDVRHGIHAPMHKLAQLPFVHKLIPGLEKLATEYHVGNYVYDRQTGQRFWESMPIYPRLGMHLLFYGGEQRKILHNKDIESILEELSVRQGRIYDSPESVKNIPSFIETYTIALDELLEPDPTKYRTMNDFFYRHIKPGARPVQNADVPGAICSAADCRLVVYPSVDLATKLWIKGNEFTIPHLLGVPDDSEQARAFEGAGVACFRLAPADYHRFHSPLDGTVGETTDIPGQYYTVNPQAVNEPGFDVFTANKRSVLYLTHTASGKQVAFVAIGAMLVGSIKWTGGAQKGSTVARGDELGFFAYGGSTVVCLFPAGLVAFDEDLVKNSGAAEPVETYVKVGWSVGKANL
ncbi:phosphatidylserine decarboxylase-domain-containing protein [Fomitopsis serialis]|uniref:phosphatidylserine decarboxylase-domain-containing protein n=1 Tax=Fomitopsis serialis TaxID=139415 RepID=UPI002007415D|nr:phosphatidylserine decarboxylase-domain-containing protein [Neoantrodia serialis]KAH9924567.1 phosphatidylserine decarboxylase-domain-containing protein [Neoantrodia serialis]